MNVEAKSQYSGILTKMEKSLFGVNYDSQTDETRIDGAYKASPSIKKYNENKRSKIIATTIEVGTALLIFLPFLL